MCLYSYSSRRLVEVVCFARELKTQFLQTNSSLPPPPHTHISDTVWFSLVTHCWTLHVFIIELYFVFSGYTTFCMSPVMSCHVTLFIHACHVTYTFWCMSHSFPTSHDCAVACECGGPMSRISSQHQLPANEELDCQLYSYTN